MLLNFSFAIVLNYLLCESSTFLINQLGFMIIETFFLQALVYFLPVKLNSLKNLRNQFKHHFQKGSNNNRRLYRFVILIIFVFWTWLIVLFLIFKIFCYLFLYCYSPFFTLRNSFSFILPILFYGWITYHLIIVNCVIIQQTKYFTLCYSVFTAHDESFYDNWVLKPYAYVFELI